MSVVFFCQRCGKRFEVDDSLIGRKARCSGCHLISRVADFPSGVASSPEVVAERIPVAKPPVAKPPVSAIAPAPTSTPSETAPFPFSIKLDHDDSGVDLLATPKSTRKRPRELAKFGDSTGPGLSLIFWGVALLLVLLAGWSMTGQVGWLEARIACVWGGVGLSVVGSIGCLVFAFKKGMIDGFLFLICTPYQLYFLATQWRKAGTWVLAYVAGIAAIVAAVLLPMPNIPTGIQTPTAGSSRPITGQAKIVIPPVGRAAPARSKIDQACKEQIRIAERLTALLRTIRNESSASRVAAEVAALRLEMNRANAELIRLAEEKGDMDAEVDESTVALVLSSTAAYEAEARRVATVPGAIAALNAGPAPPPSVTGPRLLRPPSPKPLAKNEPSRPRPGQLTEPKSTNVSLTITNVTSRDAFEVIRERLASMGDKPNAIVGGATWLSPTLRVITMSPVEDPQALARRIDFGRVVSVERRHLEIVAELPEYRPELPLSADDIEMAIDDLSRPASSRRRDGADKLYRRKAEETRRDRASRAIVPLLEDPVKETRQAAVRALAVWGTAVAVPPLIARLDDQDLMVRVGAIQALGKLGDGRAAEPLAKHLEVSGSQAFAAMALEGLGESAESAVVTRLDHSEFLVRMKACSVLSKIGTRASLPKLEAVTENQAENYTIRRLAREAIEAIGKRKSAEH